MLFDTAPTPTRMTRAAQNYCVFFLQNIIHVTCLTQGIRVGRDFIMKLVTCNF
jgi:hypothetical protein